ncbi:lipopolysaccharide assembly protein LapB [Elongatibacter sediminis]|uniref:Lipopolysaccharide assembly protein B n=1 Tax=Elongatibacter sediminis TaxID=3119006 RepID=A0AAW9R733_9GAMM
MTDLLPYLLLPFAVYFGWWVAKNYQGRVTRRRNRLFNDQYFQGLNYLLSEQPDKAIQVFLELAEVNQETVETHLALGNLFRRRGEVDRAIRFHQNIIAKPGLRPGQRTQALLELGEDYMRAGLLDRAERLFSELIESDEQTPSALRSLLEIYQQEQDWSKALEQADRLQKVEGTHQGGMMAQFCCELAEQALADGALDEARKQLRQARRHDPDSVRARFILARIHADAGNPAEAMSAYEEIAGLDPEYIPDLIEDYLEQAESSGAGQRARENLQAWYENYQGITLVLKLTEFIAADRGAEEAGQFLVESLNRKPSVRGLDRLIELRSAGHLQTDSSDDILKAVTARLMARQPGYRCGHCGFSGQSHHWQCPSCRHWGTTRIVHGVLGE